MREFKQWKVVWMNVASAAILAALAVGAYTLDMIDFILCGRLSNAVVKRLSLPTN